MNKREDFLSKNSLDGGFLQSTHWFDFQKKLGEEAFFVETTNNKVLIIENKLPLVGSYFYIPRGPVFGSDKKDNQKLVKAIKVKAQEKKVGWIRFEPQQKEDLKLIQDKLIKSKKNHQPAETLVLDLKQSQENILAGMKQKTRYNIRLSEKKGIKIKVSNNQQDLDILWDLIQETAERDGVSFHGRNYYKKMINTIPKENLELLLASDRNDKIIGAVLISYFGKVAGYLHGASSGQHRNLMANYLLQWEAIKRAKKKGMEKYDFFGIAVKKNQKKWAGITRFKKGFCPKCEPVIFPGCYDLVLSSGKYIIYRCIQMVR
jgi:lipid II:glycine glycyltransferase (peptidoglycan interpeptide bridge formation enzyme)